MKRHKRTLDKAFFFLHPQMIQRPIDTDRRSVETELGQTDATADLTAETEVDNNRVFALDYAQAFPTVSVCCFGSQDAPGDEAIQDFYQRCIADQ